MQSFTYERITETSGSLSQECCSRLKNQKTVWQRRPVKFYYLEACPHTHQNTSKSDVFASQIDLKN